MPLILNLRYNCTVQAGYSQRKTRRKPIRANTAISRKTPPKKSRNRPVRRIRKQPIGARCGLGLVTLP